MLDQWGEQESLLVAVIAAIVAMMGIFGARARPEVTLSDVDDLRARVRGCRSQISQLQAQMHALDAKYVAVEAELDELAKKLVRMEQGRRSWFSSG